MNSNNSNYNVHPINNKPTILDIIKKTSSLSNKSETNQPVNTNTPNKKGTFDPFKALIKEVPPAPTPIPAKTSKLSIDLPKNKEIIEMSKEIIEEENNAINIINFLKMNSDSKVINTFISKNKFSMPRSDKKNIFFISDNVTTLDRKVKLFDSGFLIASNSNPVLSRGLKKVTIDFPLTNKSLAIKYKNSIIITHLVKDLIGNVDNWYWINENGPSLILNDE